MFLVFWFCFCGESSAANSGAQTPLLLILMPQTTLAWPSAPTPAGNAGHPEAGKYELHLTHHPPLQPPAQPREDSRYCLNPVHLEEHNPHIPMSTATLLQGDGVLVLSAQRVDQGYPPARRADRKEQALSGQEENSLGGSRRRYGQRRACHQHPSPPLSIIPYRWLRFQGFLFLLGGRGMDSQDLYKIRRSTGSQAAELERVHGAVHGLLRAQA